MNVAEISQLISQVGFPIFVAGFMLIKQSKDTENMVNILTKLQVSIDNLAKQNEGEK